MNGDDPLARPVWHALAARQAAFAIGDARARRFVPEVGCFAAAADDTPENLAALARLCPPGGELILMEAQPPAALPGLVARRREAALQMVLGTPSPDGADVPAVPLGDADAPEMLALATRTRPGPFFARTHRLGGFVGVRAQGRLVAMAGERLALFGFTEVSGVCTDPAYRGRGLAGALMRLVAARIVARDETPILHTYAANAGAVALYQTLGFRTARKVTIAVFGRLADAAQP